MCLSVSKCAWVCVVVVVVDVDAVCCYCGSGGLCCCVCLQTCICILCVTLLCEWVYVSVYDCYCAVCACLCFMNVCSVGVCRKIQMESMSMIKGIPMCKITPPSCNLENKKPESSRLGGHIPCSHGPRAKYSKFLILTVLGYLQLHMTGKPPSPSAIRVKAQVCTFFPQVCYYYCHDLCICVNWSLTTTRSVHWRLFVVGWLTMSNVFYYYVISESMTKVKGQWA